MRGVVESSTTSQMAIKANGQPIFTLNFPAVLTGSLTHAFARESIGSISSNGGDVQVEITFNNNGNPSANAYLDYIEVIGKKQLIAGDEQFGFRNLNTANANGIVQYEIQNGNGLHVEVKIRETIKIENKDRMLALHEYFSLRDVFSRENTKINTLFINESGDILYDNVMKLKIQQNENFRSIFCCYSVLSFNPHVIRR